MKLIIGLGNPGAKYASTRHNFGYLLIDQLASKYSLTLTEKSTLSAQFATRNQKNNSFLLAKPSTYMNESGQAVRALMDYYDINTNDILVTFDDFNLDFGTIRLRHGGSDGGHNGVKSIIGHIGSDFSRLRLGIKNQQFSKMPTENFVLQNFESAEQDQINEILDKAAIFCQQFIDSNEALEHQTIR